MSPCPWNNLPPGTISFCEQRLCSWIAEPANTWSNIGYFLVGAYLLALGARRAGRVRDRRTLILGATSILVGIGSTAFHATGNLLGEFLDNSAMFLISGALVALCLQRLCKWDSGRALVVFAALASTSMLVLLRIPSAGIAIFSGQLLLFALLELLLWWSNRSSDYRDFWVTVFGFATAFGIWNLDKWNVVCDPHNHVFNGHAAWHLLTALCLLPYAQFLRQFEPPTRVAWKVHPRPARQPAAAHRTEPQRAWWSTV